jgi:hypothetical protein
MPKYPKRIRAYHLDRALDQLAIKQKHGSAYHTRLVNNRLEIHVLGGQVYYWPPDEQESEEANAA